MLDLESAEPHLPPRRNLEQKFRCADLEFAHAAALAAGALASDILHHRDVFFHAARGRLKLRCIEPSQGLATAELIAYDRPDGPGERLSTYRIVPVAEPDVLEAALAAALGMRGVVRKRRRLLMSGNMRLHFDEVEDLGSFVEFEAVLAPGESEDEARRHIERWRGLLGLNEPIACSYIDLLAPPPA